MLRSGSEEVATLSIIAEMLSGRKEVALYRVVCLIKINGVSIDTRFLNPVKGVIGGKDQLLTVCLIAPPFDVRRLGAAKVLSLTAVDMKHSSIIKPGMNDGEVYGQVICNVPAPKLVEEGYILPPKVSITELPQGDFKQSDCQNLLDTIDGNSLNKILIAARSTRQIVKLLAESDFYHQLRERGYSCLYITSKTGAFIDGVKVDRDEFFKTLNAWGKDPEKRFVVIHHSILSEGINVNGLEAVLFMRNMDCIGISQSIGRVIRLGDRHKTFGLVCVPVYDKVGIGTARSVQAVVDTVFEQGQPAISTIRR